MGLFGELSFNDNCDKTNNQYPHPMAADTPRYVPTLWIGVPIINVVVGGRDIPWCVRRGGWNDGMHREEGKTGHPSEPSTTIFPSKAGKKRIILLPIATKSQKQSL